MTIKNTNKNVSAENHEDVVVSASFENGVLTLIRKNLYDESISEGKKILIDMHKLKLKVLDSKQTLDQLEVSTREEDIRERESYIFLVPFETGEEGVYREYIWVEEENDVNGGEFEVIGSTKTDLEPYFKKENIYNALDYIEAGKALDARQGKVLNDKFSDYLTTALASSTYVAKETGKGLSTEDFTLEEKTKLASLSNVATTGNYNDLNNKPSIPTQTSQLTNNSGFLTSQDIAGKEDASNKVTSLSASSTDTQYPSAKATYDAIPKETITLTINYTDGSPSEDIEFYIK